MKINPSANTKDTFEKFKSNAIGDAYIDPGQYYLRPKSSGQVGNFRPSGGKKTVKHSEFEHMPNGPPPRPMPEKNKGYMTRSTYETFQKKIPYTEDLYENKDDKIRADYIKRKA